MTGKTSFSIGAGQTLKGNGTVNIGAGKTVNLAGGGTLAPGNSVGSLNITGNLDLTGGTTAFELGTPGTSHALFGLSDSTAVTGNLTLGGILSLIDNAGANGQGFAGGGCYKIFTYTGTESGSFASVTGWGTGTQHVSVNNVPADKAVYLDITSYATVNPLATPITLNSIHVGGSFGTKGVLVQNTNTNGDAENLAATFGTPTSPVHGQRLGYAARRGLRQYDDGGRDQRHDCRGQERHGRRRSRPRRLPAEAACPTPPWPLAADLNRHRQCLQFGRRPTR